MPVALWILAYLMLVLGPLFALLLPPAQPGLGFLWDLAMALGFSGLGMMGVQFLLTARFKKATAPFGIDIIYYFHRYLGVIAFALVAAHAGLVLIDNPALFAFFNPARAPGYMTAGILSALAMVVLVAASLGRKRFHIPYDGWRVTHAMLAAGATALAAVHIQGVQYYLATPWKAGLWHFSIAVWLGVMVFVRLVRPWQLARHPYVVREVREERGDAWTLVLDPDGHDGFSFAPGQFSWLTLGASPFGMTEHPFSMSAPDTGRGRIELTIKALGDFTRTIGTTRLGTRAYVDGPYGAFSPARHPAPGYVLIAGGIGIAPMMSMLRALADAGDTRPVWLFYAYRRWERMTFREALDGLTSRMRLTVINVLEEPPAEWTGEQGRITDSVLGRHLPADGTERSRLHYFLCGPQAMTDAMERTLHEMGIPRTQVHSELFDMV